MPTCGTAVPHAIYLNRSESCVGCTCYYCIGSAVSYVFLWVSSFACYLESYPVKGGGSSALSEQQLSATKD